MRSWSRSSLYLSVALVAIGFLVIFFGWNGAAEKDFIQGQFPYLLSGGLVGMGLILCGLTLAAMQSFRRDILTLQDKIEELLEARPVAGAPPGAGGAASLAAVPDTDDVVVATGSTYHRPSCRTIQGRAGLEMLSAEDAAASDLSACRVCQPAASAAS